MVIFSFSSPDIILKIIVIKSTYLFYLTIHYSVNPLIYTVVVIACKLAFDSQTLDIFCFIENFTTMQWVSVHPKENLLRHNSLFSASFSVRSLLIMLLLTPWVHCSLGFPSLLHSTPVSLLGFCPFLSSYKFTNHLSGLSSIAIIMCWTFIISSAIFLIWYLIF